MTTKFVSGGETFLSIAAAAAALGKSKSAVFRMVKGKRIRCVRTPNQQLWVRETVIDTMTGQRRTRRPTA